MTRPWLAGALVAAGLTAACSVEWGGAEFAMEDPAPPPDSTAAEQAPDPLVVPIPAGPLIYLARLSADGTARLVPLATLGPSDEEADWGSVVFPDSADDGYRTRFDSAFFAPGTELELHAGGRRIGSLVLDGGAAGGTTGCPGIGSARALLFPGVPASGLAFALPRRGPATSPARGPALAPTRSMNIAGPVLAERLIDDERAFMARRVALHAVEMPDDTLAGMAATYLVADSLRSRDPGGAAISLFFLARFEPALGFIPQWTEVRRYDSSADKEAFDYLDWIALPEGRYDFVRRYGGSGVSLTASRLEPEGDPADREITWVEPDGCSALQAVGG